ncbi:hypothetical protein QFZ34_002069 [Phyllobacterium ifriqiyense]|uniref:Uncharacterized protein n=1 Tax=Phyllobacterium ifriqiyense TaxID=314238 RepID=A0ABU0S818_9HYPH|nr:hypothetical protein [Phyllobacterium ifriqiyense]MDQ0996887.1 hypothetical protein [Phyllobacterium ifriqiyense]
MFTIKQVVRSGQKSGKDDAVRLYEGRDPSLETGPSGNQQVTFQKDDGVYCSIDSGVVFVMNSTGKTVETFRLKGAE